MSAKLTIARHPLTPSQDRQHWPRLSVAPGTTLAALLAEYGVTPDRVWVVSLNGRIVAPEAWAVHRLKQDDRIAVRAWVAGGGGKKSPLATVLSIAVSLAAPGIGTAIAGSLGLAGATAFGVSAGTIFGGLVSIAGKFLISSLLPAPRQSRATPGTPQGVSPTYSLAGGQNRARPFEPLPLVLGTHRIFPDLDAKPYSELIGAEQFLMQSFNFGLADLDISDIRIGQTPVTQYEEIATEFSGSTGALTIFPGNVDTYQGGTVTTGGAWVQRTTSIDTTQIAVDFSGSGYGVNKNNGRAITVVIRYEIEYSATGAGVWIGAVEGSSSFRFTYSLIGRYRRGHIWSVPKGQYDVRVRLISVEQDAIYTHPENNQVTDENHTWNQLRAYQPDTADYTGQRRMAMRVRASGQLSGQLEAVSALASASVPVWDGATWTTGPTSNPAWQFLYLARGKFDGAGRRLFGAGLADARIDIDTLKSWGAYCDQNGLACNIVFDGAIPVQEMLEIVARTGRALPTWQSGALGVVWDAANLPTVQLFGMANIVAGSFAVEYRSEQPADEIVAQFINPDLDWSQDTVRVTVPGSVTPARTATVALPGVTDKAQAGKEANLLAAEQIYHARRMRWETDMEGLVCGRGDVVELSHDLTSWGVSGRILSGASTTAVQLDQAITITTGTAHYLQVRRPNGAISAHLITDPGSTGDYDTLTLTDALPAIPDTDTAGGAPDWIYQAGPQATPGRRVKIIEVRPAGEDRVRLIARDDDPLYYAAETNPYTHTSPAEIASRLPTITDLTVDETLIRVAGGFGVRLTVTWRATGDYDHAEIRYGLAEDGLGLPAPVRGTRADVDLGAVDGNVTVAISGYNARGETGPTARAQIVHTIVGLAAPPGDVPWFALDGQRLSWGAAADADVIGYRVRYHLAERHSWGDAIALHDGLIAASPWTPPAWPVGGGTVTFLIVAVDGLGNESGTPAAIVTGLGDAPLANVVVTSDLHADGFPGVITDATVNGGTGDLEADSGAPFYDAGNNAANFYSDNQNDEFYVAEWLALDYESAVFGASASLPDNTVQRLSYTLAGISARVDWRPFGGSIYYDADASADFYGASAAEHYETPGDWRPWPGDAIAKPGYQQIRIVTGQGATRGAVSKLQIIYDAPDIRETVNDVAIAAGGTRLTLAETYQAIKAVTLTLQDDAGSARTARVLDKDAASGPLVQCFDSSGVGAAGTVDGAIAGY